MDLRARINEALKEAMRAKAADRLGVLRLVTRPSRTAISRPAAKGSRRRCRTMA